VVVAWVLWFVVAVCAIAVLESSSWAPVREPRPENSGRQAHRFRVAWPGRGRATPSLVESLLIAFIAIAFGLSPVFYGFYDMSVWAPIALGVLAALLALLIARPAVPRRGALIAAGALVGMWLWALLSTGWAESADQALTEANRWLLYAALFGVLILLLRDDRLGLILIAAGAATVLLLGVYVTVRMLGGSGGELFFRGRLHEPLGYGNGQSGYLLMGVWPFIAAAERARRPLIAGAAVAAATFLAGLVLLGQTRAVVPAAALSVVLMLVAVPGRTRRAWALAAVIAGVAACLGPVLDVYESVQGTQPPDAALREAAGAILLASAGAGALWALALVAARRFGPRLGSARRFAWAPLAVVAVLVVAVGLATVSDPVERVRANYDAFVELRRTGDASSRFATGGGNRYDYWRIALDQFGDQPLRGIGAGNYDGTYFLERRTAEDVRQPHSLVLQTLGELGLVGGLLLAAFLVAVFAGFVRRARDAAGDPGVRVLAVAAGGTFTVWLVHTSVDWLHLIPGLTGIALCSAAVLVGPWRRDRARRTGRARLAAVVVCGLAVAVGAAFLGRAALADRYLQEGRDALAERPGHAIERAGASLRLNDERLDTYYLESAAWARLGDYERARAALGEATRREPRDSVTWALLGDLATRRGDAPRALRDYRRAHALNPRNAALGSAVREARRQAGR
jgi:tetratricopeptide (TPR) repeat protein